jgi:hypothetical protein
VRGLSLNRAKNLRNSKHEEILDSEVLNVDSGVPGAVFSRPAAAR